MREVGVRSDEVGLDGLSVREGDATRDTALHFDLGDRALVADVAAELFELLHHRTHERAGAAAREVHAPRLFDEVNHRVDGRHRERVAADQERLEREHCAHLVALEVVLHEREERTQRIEPHQIGQHAQHRRGRIEVRVAELEEASLEDGARCIVEAFVALEILRRDHADLRARSLGVAVVVEVAAVRKIDPIEGLDRNEIDVALGRRTVAAVARAHARGEVRTVEIGVALLEREQLFDEVRNGEHGRAHVEHEAVARAHVRATTGTIELLEHRGAEAHRGRAESRARARRCLRR